MEQQWARKNNSNDIQFENESLGWSLSRFVLGDSSHNAIPQLENGRIYGTFLSLYLRLYMLHMRILFIEYTTEQKKTNGGKNQLGKIFTSSKKRGKIDE